jgi:hypothetical protein
MGSPKTPKVPKPPPPPPAPPPPEPQVEDALKRSRDDRRRLALAAAGRQGTIVTGAQGLTGPATLGSRTLLGSA